MAYLGVDAGGTKTAWVLLDTQRHELARGELGPCNASAMPSSELESVVSELKLATPSSPNIEWLVFAMAGYSSNQGRAVIEQALENAFPGIPCRTAPDYQAAYWGASDGEPGVAICAGTGAVAFGRNHQGVDKRIDGRGYLLGDLGSGYWIGSEAIKEVVRQWESCQPMGLLGAAIQAHTQCLTTEELVAWVYREFTPAKIAELAPAVGNAADRGDLNAELILRSAASCLWNSVEQVIIALRLPPRVQAYRCGGLWNISPRLEGHFLHAAGEVIELLPSKHDAAYGAGLMAQYFSSS